MRNPFFLLVVFVSSALAAGWLYPGDRTSDLVPTVTAGGEGRVLEESLKTATVARVDPAGGMITLKGPDGKLTAFGTGEGVRNLLEVKDGDQVLEPGNDPVAAAQKAVARSEPNEMSAGGLVRLVEMTGTVEKLDELSGLAPPKGPVEESPTITDPDLTDL